MKYILTIILAMFALSYNANSQSIIDNIKLKDVDGNRVSMDTVAAKGNALIVCFWSTSCKPCIQELDAMAKIKDQWNGNIDVVAVSIDDSRSLSRVKILSNGRKWPFRVLVDETRELYRLFNVSQIPTVVIVGSDGKVAYQHTGYLPGNEKSLVKEALKHTSK